MRKRDLFLILLIFKFIDLSLPYLLSLKSENMNKEVYLSIFHWPPDSTIDIKAYYKTFDAQHYLYLAEKWYLNDLAKQNAFFPLFPFLIKIFTFLTGSFFLSGIILSNVLSFIGFYVLYEYLKKTNRSPNPIIFLFLTFPASFFFTRIYTESLFFLLLILLTYAIHEKMKWIVLILSILLPLSRPHGVITSVAVFLMVFLDKENRKIFLLSLVGFILGSLIYLVVMYFSTGNMFASLTAQRLYPRVNPLSMLFNPLRWVKENFLYPSYALRYMGMGNFIYERLIFLFFVLAILLGYKNLLKVEYVILIVPGLFSALTDHFESFSRYILPLFPLYIALWGVLRKNKILYYIVVIVFMIHHIFLLTLHSLSYFVG